VVWETKREQKGKSKKKKRAFGLEQRGLIKKNLSGKRGIGTMRSDQTGVKKKKTRAKKR